MKIKSIDEIAPIASALKKDGKTIVHCHGVFDLLHPGHVLHLKSAKKLGDVLVVSITADEFVNKGPGRPAFPLHLRAEVLAALEMVDFVVLSDSPTAIRAIHAVKPNLYVKGSEYENIKNDVTGKIVDEEQAVQQGGGKLHFTNDITFSSSNLINSFMSTFSPEAESWLKSFRAKHSADSVKDLIQSLESVRVLGVGKLTAGLPFVHTSVLGSEDEAILLKAISEHDVVLLAANDEKASLPESFLKKLQTSGKFLASKSILKGVPTQYVYLNASAKLDEKSLPSFAKELLTEQLTLNRGTQGVWHYSRPDGVTHAPAFAKTMGALKEEAIFSVCAVLAYKKTSSDMLSFITNVMNGQSTLEVSTLAKHAMVLLK